MIFSVFFRNLSNLGQKGFSCQEEHDCVISFREEINPIYINEIFLPKFFDFRFYIAVFSGKRTPRIHRQSM